MNTIRLLIIAVTFGLYATNASAFEQTQMGGAAPSDQNASQPAVPGVQLVTPDRKAKPSAGTQLRLPGFGVIGTLPKLDFGLELLYGEDGGANVADEDRGQVSEGLTIHGSLKHKF